MRDCFLVAPGHAFVIGTDLARPRPAAEVFAGPPTGLVADVDGGTGPAFRCIGGWMEMGPLPHLLGDALPPVILLQATHPASLRIDGFQAQIEAEMTEPAVGATATATAAMQMIIVDLIRSLPEDAPRGWLKALEDPRISPALRAIHGGPLRKWRLEDLDGLAYLSRSQFIVRFHRAVGRTPMDYLLHWRMALAQRALSRPVAPRVAGGCGSRLCLAQCLWRGVPASDGHEPAPRGGPAAPCAPITAGHAPARLTETSQLVRFDIVSAPHLSDWSGASSLHRFVEGEWQVWAGSGLTPHPAKTSCRWREDPLNECSIEVCHEGGAVLVEPIGPKIARETREKRVDAIWAHRHWQGRLEWASVKISFTYDLSRYCYRKLTC